MLAAKPRNLAKSFGYTERPTDTISGWSYHNDCLRYVVKHSEQGNPFRRESVFRPEIMEPGTQAVRLDSEGRLLEPHVRPPVDLATGGTPGFQWLRLFAAAGLDPHVFQEAKPEMTPAAPFDAQAAWI